MRLNSVNRDTLRRSGARGLLLLGAVWCLTLGFSSCESIFDDQSDCRSGIALSFVYEYHMEPGANAFPANVDCVDVLVFDARTGDFVKHFVEASDLLRDPAYAMEIPLEEGDYHLVVWGGLACDDAAFEFTPRFPDPETSDAVAGRAPEHRKEHIRVSLPYQQVDSLDRLVSARQLHDIEAHTGGLFYGTLDVSITERAYDYKRYTVEMMKDTNNIQVILQELSQPDAMNVDDYLFWIEDDNFVLNGFNLKPEAAPAADADPRKPVYMPYAAETVLAGWVDAGNREGVQVEEDPDREVKVAMAEFSTSRLLFDHIESARLKVASKRDLDSDGNYKTIIDIPLIRYLAMTRGYGQRWIKSDQEYLDRQSNWSMMFFLQRNAWVKTLIVVNWWTVRVNEIELGQ